MDHPFELELNKVISCRPDLHFFGHNFVFDLLFAHKHGINIIGSVEDTAVTQAIINEFQGSYSLEKCCYVMGVQEKKGEDLYRHMSTLFGGEALRKIQMPNFWRLEGDDKYGTDYAEGDGTSNWQLREAQIARINDNDLANVYELEKKVTRVLFRMQRKGVKIDEYRLDEVEAQVKKKSDEAKSKLPPDFNPRSPIQMKKYLISHGITEFPKTLDKDGNPTNRDSFNKKWLATIAPGKVIIEARECDHLINSFIRPLKDKHIYNGFVSPSYFQLVGDEFGTITGRLSCSDPNLQQIPKRNYDLGSLFRSVFVPDPKHLWYSADYSQCEPRLLAHYAQCKALIDGYLNDPPVDAHTSVANAAGIDRESGKRLNQTLITGGGQGKVFDELMAVGKTYSECMMIWNAYFSAMPEIKPLQKRAAHVMRSRGYIISLLGRKSRLEQAGKEYKAVNRLLQCGNADVIKKAMVDIDNYLESEGDRVRIINNVHDSLDISAHPDDRKILDEALRLMSDFGPGRSVELTVPLAVECGQGVNWSEATYTKDKWMVGQ